MDPTPDLAAVLDAVTPPLAVLARDGTVGTVNAAWTALLGPVLAPGASLPALLRRDPHRRGLLDGLQTVLDGTCPAFRAEVHDTDLQPPGWWRVQVGSLAAGGAVVVLSDITDLKRAETDLTHQASHDPLTALPNRLVLEAELARPRTGRALLFLDVDDFKLVNDGYGHEVGDALLAAVAARLRAALPEEAVLVRFAGDEFVVLVRVVGEVHALGLADALLTTFLAPFQLQGVELSVTASVGVALAHHEDSDLLGDADAALFEAKARGRARHALSDDRVRGRTRNRLELTQALRRAAGAGELRLYHQPVVDLSDGTCHGVEALLRWERPDSGLVLPGSFLQIAEEAGLIVPLGAWVLEEAVRQAAEWARAGRPLSVAVNLSPRQLVDRRLSGQVEDALARHALSPSLLRVEVTESAALDSDEGERALRDLQEMGIGVAVDDFGTGYSSLARLRHLPGVDTLKVDQSFVRGVPHVQDDQEIVTAVLHLARALGLVVIAEGVESGAQASWLRAHGCQLGQGWLFGAAVPAEQLLPWLDEHLPQPHTSGTMRG